MKLFGRKKTIRGASKGYQVRLKEEQAKADIKLAQMWTRYLEEHPSYAMEIAKEKFGGVTSRYEPEGGEAPPDLLDILRQAKEAKDLIKDELGTQGQTNWKDILKTVLEVLPAVPQLLQQIKGQGALPEPPPTPRLEQPKKSSVEEQQAGLKNYITRLLSVEPSECAMQIYQAREDHNNILSFVYAYMTEKSFEELIEMLPMVSSIPGYEFLEPLVARLDKKHLALVYDEVVALKKAEDANKKALDVD